MYEMVCFEPWLKDESLQSNSILMLLVLKKSQKCYKYSQWYLSDFFNFSRVKVCFNGQSSQSIRYLQLVVPNLSMTLSGIMQIHGMDENVKNWQPVQCRSFFLLHVVFSFSSIQSVRWKRSLLVFSRCVTDFPWTFHSFLHHGFNILKTHAAYQFHGNNCIVPHLCLLWRVLKEYDDLFTSLGM